MKKKMFFLMSLALLVFVSCDPDVVPTSDVTKVTIKPSTLDLLVGDTVRVNAILEPSGVTANVAWSSSDTSIVKVSNVGVVVASSTGTAVVTAKVGNVQGTCTVTVKSYIDAWELNSFGFFGNPTMIAGTDTVLSLTIGDMSCQLGTISCYAWDKNVDFVEGTGFVGNGMVIIGDVPLYWITQEGDYNGYYIGSTLFIKDTTENAAYVMTPGKVLDVQAYGAALTASEFSAEDYEASLSGTLMMGADFYYPYYALIKSGALDTDDSDATIYSLNIDWFDMDGVNADYGLKLTEDGSDFVVPYELVVTNKSYEYLGETAQAAPALIKSHKLHLTQPTKAHYYPNPIKTSNLTFKNFSLYKSALK